MEQEQAQPPAVSRRPLQAKAKNIFPKEREADRTSEIPAAKKRHFRFPVVPDDYQVKPPSQRGGKTIDVEIQPFGRERLAKDRLTGKDPAGRESRSLPERDIMASSRVAGESGRHYRQAERGNNVREMAERTVRPAGATGEKKGYKPSDVVSPVFGKITPTTHEAKHRIHTTAGIVYPRLEQEELLRRKRLEERQKQEAAHSDIAREEAVTTMEDAAAQVFLGLEEEMGAKQAEEALHSRQEEWEKQPENLPDTVESQPEAADGQQATGDGSLPGNETEQENSAGPGSYPEENREQTAAPASLLSNVTGVEKVETAASGDPRAGDCGAASADFPETDSSHSAAADPAQPAYVLPKLDLLNPSPPPQADNDEHTQLQKMLLEETLSNFHVSAQVVGIVKGPSVTRFELQPAPGVKVNKITSLQDDIKLNLAAKDIRIEAPIPGRNAIGIEVPNLHSEPVLIEKIIRSRKFQEHPSPLAVALGMDIGGEPIVADIKKMPHGLIAGATGSGKSVCINSIIVSLLFKATPEQVRLLLIDPKMVELIPYNNLPHLVTPVVTEARHATAALKWAVEEMERRYALFVDAGVRDIERYNQTANETLPYIVVVIDELADLMMVAPQDVEDCIIRIAQKARACGIHLLLATQRPSVDVITGNIKANVPTRLAFAVFSQVDSRTILDQSGAERLLGRGDMLFLESGAAPIRLQGNYVSDDEIERVTAAIKKQRKPSYLFSKEDLEHQAQSFETGDDPLYLEALVYVAEQGQASASGLQRRFRVGYNRAARLIEMMEADGYVSGQNGGKPRTVLISPEDAHALAEGSKLL